MFSHFFYQKIHKPLPDKLELLVKSKMAAILDDVTGPQQYHNLQLLPYLLDHMRVAIYER